MPFPVNYGGVYDLFYKLVALKSLGVFIHLHCFDNGREPQAELDKYCAEVHYYARDTGARSLSLRLPYIVKSRRNAELRKRLLKDDFPILMEGTHCTWLLNDEAFKARKKFVRLHNVEHLYYYKLFKCTNGIQKKLYYWWESKLLKSYENKIISKANAFWAVTGKDAEYIRNEFSCKSVFFLPLFLPGWKVCSKEGIGQYCLYHGNLSVAENEFAAAWLIKNIFKKSAIRLIIAGKNPSKKLRALTRKYKNIELIPNPTESKMESLIADAHIHVLPSFNSTGIKLKLLNALYNGRHCVVNSEMADNTGLDELTHIKKTASGMKQLIEQMYYQPFLLSEIKTRKKLLEAMFDNNKNAEQVVEWIWGENVTV
ncbi:MAG: glycosyltransferase [Chitinophagaceae bacterium]